MSDKDLKNDGLRTNKFSIIDMLMIIMVVGVVLTIIIPLRLTRQQEQLVRESIPEIQKILIARAVYQQNHEFGDFPMNLESLTSRSEDAPPLLTDLNTSVFAFTLTDTTIVATTTKLATTEKSYFYDLRDNRFRVSEDSKDVIIDAWLP